MSIRWVVISTSLLGLAGCAASGDGARCTGGKCDNATDVRSQLDDHDNPIADFLRASDMSDEGVLETDYFEVARGVGEQIGCSMDTLRTFVLSDDLLADEPFPRVISTLCRDDAADFFLAGSFADPDRPYDIDLHNLEMFAWDRTEKRYVFFAMLPIEGTEGEVQVEVEPRRCERCHLNATSLDADHMPMTPLMNELTRPWPHWSAEPDFPSHSFVLPEATRTAPNFSELTAGERRTSASELEQIIRTAQTSRVVNERVKLRRKKPADVGEAMSLLRPIFCTEQVNYVSEDHGSSVLPIDAILSGGTGNLFRAVQNGWPWPWLNDGQLRFQSSSDQPLAMIPVRGNHDVEYERRLVAVRALDPMDVLRARALDWKRPVFSGFRCDLWKDALARLREDPPDVDPEARNLDLLPELYSEIMQRDGESLIPEDPETLIVMADAGRPEEAEVLDLEGFGHRLQAWMDEIEADGGRTLLRARRDRRLCVVEEDFPNRPALPDYADCAAGPRSPGLAQPASEVATLGEASGPVFTGVNREVRLIPDGSADGVASPIDSDLSIFLAGDQVTVRVAVDHDWRGDLTLILTAPDGATSELVSFDPADSADDVDRLFVVRDLPTGTATAGAWTLTAIDDRVGAQGFLEGWSLGIGTVAPRLVGEGARWPPGF